MIMASSDAELQRLNFETGVSMLSIGRLFEESLPRPAPSQSSMFQSSCDRNVDDDAKVATLYEPLSVRGIECGHHEDLG